ncbi:Calcineurin-like phosphoesterase domain, ApaH type [Dillenia turbinata]|uniref:Purple acid phosphatase n=1 Tax=Dillenia turbinata TaxID=194707 RepID=A0AAN8UT71_9MAGN
MASVPSKPMLILTCILGLCLGSGLAELQRLEHSAKPDGSLSFLVVGDWGRKGFYNQSQVAFQMGKVGEKLDIDFVISVGDNFYDDGLTVLGNHDYRGDVLAQLNPILSKMDTRWLCLRSFILNAEIAEFFFVDTTPFVDKYFTRPGHSKYDWRGVLPREEYRSNLLKDLDSALRESSAKWKIVVGHHAIRSAGHHGDTEELVSRLLPILKANNVDLYINGHDHCLQHISSTHSPLQFLTSGGGSKAWRGDFNWSPEVMKFYYDGQGFMSVQITKTLVDFAFYDVFGNVLHKWTVNKELNLPM